MLTGQLIILHGLSTGAVEALGVILVAVSITDEIPAETDGASRRQKRQREERA